MNKSFLEEVNLKPDLPEYVIKAAYNRNKKTREIGKDLSFLLNLFKEKNKNIKIYNDQDKSEKFNSLLNNKEYSSGLREKLSQFVDRKVILEQPKPSRWKPSYVFALFLATAMGLSFMPAKYAYDSTEATIKNHKTKQEFRRYVEAKGNLQDSIEENEIIQIKTQKEIGNLEKAIIDKKESEFFCVYPTEKNNLKEIVRRGFGWKLHPILEDPNTGGPATKHHDGIDIPGEIGDNVYAAETGIIRFKGLKGGYGKTIDIEHEGGWRTRYGHLNSFDKDLKVGDEVEKGQFIADLGSTGLSTGPHLQFEIRKKIIRKNKSDKITTWHPINPLPLIKTKEELKYLNKDLTVLEAQADSQQILYSSLISSKDSLEKEILQEHIRHDSIGDYIDNSNMLKLIF